MTERRQQESTDLGAVFDVHVASEFVARDVDATLATMTDAPYVTHVPVSTGGFGLASVREFYSRYFVGHWPADTRIESISRTIGQGRVIDEAIVHFTHDIPMPALLPGIPPSGRVVEIPTVIVMELRDGKVHHEHIYWDQASLLVQVGALDPGALPVQGVEQARKLRNPALPTNTLIERQRS